VTGQKRVKVFSTSTCHWCKVAKAYLDDHDIEYTEYDVIHDLEARREMLLATGQHGVPVILVGDKAMVGWNEAEFLRLLNRTTKKWR